MAENRVKVNSSGGEICPGCSSKYAFNIDNLRTNIARIIPDCGHNLCEQCVVTEGTSTGQVRCRHSGCSTKILWTGNLDVFLPNMLVLGRVVYLQLCPPVAPNQKNAASVSASLESHVVCGECDDKTADCFCQNCDTNLCSPCFNNIHKHAKSLMKHKSLPLAMDDTGRKVLELLKIPDCVDHMKRIQYVADDGGVGCEGCLKLGKLRGLKVNSVESYNQKKRKDLADKVMEGKNKLDRLKSVRASLKSEDEEEVVKSEELASKIKLYFSDCYSQLQTLEHHLCQKLETQLKTKQTENERLVKIISEKINEVSSFLKIAEEAVSKDSGIDTYNFNEMIKYITKLEYPSAMIKSNRPNSLELNLNVDPSFLNVLKSHVDLIEKEVPGVNDAPLRQVPEHNEDPTNTDQTVARENSGHLNTQERLISTSEGGEKRENLSPVTIFSENIIHSQESGDSLQSEGQDEIEQLVENVANTRSESPNSEKVFKSSHIDKSQVSNLDTIPVKEFSNKPMTHSMNTFKSQTEKSSKDIVKPINARQNPDEKLEIVNKAEDFKNAEQIKQDEGVLQYHVSHMESPSRIYVLSSNDSERASQLTDSLSNKVSKRSFGNHPHWNVGDYCAAKQDPYIWARARIINLTHSDSDASLVATLFFYDSGKILEIPGDGLKILPKQLKQDPPLAKQVHLSDIRPTGGTDQWSITAREKLKEILDEGEEFTLLNDGEKVVDESLGISSQPVKIMISENIETGPFSPSDREEVSLSQKLLDEGLALRTANYEIVKRALLVPENFGHKFRPMSTILEFGESISSKAVDRDDFNSSGVGALDDAEKIGTSEKSFNSSIRQTDNNGFMWTSSSPLQQKHFIGTPTHVDWNCTVYIQTAENKSKARKIQQFLNSKYSRSCPEAHDLYWFAGQACIAQFEVDKNWCRGRVVKAAGPGVFVVEFVDYGNTEEMKPNEMRKVLEDQCFHLKELFCQDEPVQCFQFQLVDVVPKSPDEKWSQKVLDFIHKLVVDQNLQVSVTSGLEEGFPVKGKLQTLAGVDISELLVKNGYAEWADGFSRFVTSVQINQSQESLPSFQQERSFVTNESLDDSFALPHVRCYLQQDLSHSYQVGDTFEVMVVDQIDPDVVVCLLVSDFPKTVELINEMIEELQISGDEQPLVADPTVGFPVIARFSIDRKWYRAVVINKSPQKVLFVDYGNTEETDEVRCLPPGLEELPQQVVFLQAVPKVDVNQPELTSPEGFNRCRLLQQYSSVPPGSMQPLAAVQFIKCSQK